MKNVLVTRFEQSDLKFIEEYSRKKDVDKSTVIRELYRYGREFLAIKMYEEGKTTIGNASKIAGLSIGEFMDLLEKMRIPLTVTQEDVLEGIENLKQAMQKK